MNALGKIAEQLSHSIEKLVRLAIHYGGDYGPRLLEAVAILAAGWIAARLVCRVLQRALDRTRLDATLSGFSVNLAYMATMTFVVVAALEALGVKTTSFVAILGAAALAIGFALQGSLSNFAAGVLLIIFRPFKVGDIVDAAGVNGEVVEIQVFATVLRTPDHKRIVVPNSAITASNIVNYSVNPMRRIDLVIGIAYNADIRRAKQVIETVIARDARVLAEPKPQIGVLELAESSVNLAVRPWVKTLDFGPAKFDITEAIKLALDAEGIAIPFPHREIIVRHAPADSIAEPSQIRKAA
jgi:small conductance mechanosensitive channel